MATLFLVTINKMSNFHWIAPVGSEIMGDTVIIGEFNVRFADPKDEPATIRIEREAAGNLCFYAPGDAIIEASYRGLPVLIPIHDWEPWAAEYLEPITPYYEAITGCG